MTESELNDVRGIKERIRDLEWHLKTLKLSVEKMVPIIDGLPHASDAKSKVEELTVQIIDDERELENLREQFVSATIELTSKINALKLSQMEKTVLIMRYGICMNFQNIWLELGISDARLFYIHRTALKKILKSKVD